MVLQLGEPIRIRIRVRIRSRSWSRSRSRRAGPTSRPSHSVIGYVLLCQTKLCGQMFARWERGSRLGWGWVWVWVGYGQITLSIWLVLVLCTIRLVEYITRWMSQRGWTHGHGCGRMKGLWVQKGDRWMTTLTSLISGMRGIILFFSLTFANRVERDFLCDSRQ